MSGSIGADAVERARALAINDLVAKFDRSGLIAALAEINTIPSPKPPDRRLIPSELHHDAGCQQQRHRGGGHHLRLRHRLRRRHHVRPGDQPGARRVHPGGRHAGAARARRRSSASSTCAGGSSPRSACAAASACPPPRARAARWRSAWSRAARPSRLVVDGVGEVLKLGADTHEAVPINLDARWRDLAARRPPPRRTPPGDPRRRCAAGLRGRAPRRQCGLTGSG